MEYLVFARKYRPQTFDEVVGQEHVTTTLKNAIQNNRVAHAYIFCGPRGIGKTTVARILAKALNCENGPTISPCNNCIPCREITRGISMDVIEIDGASNRGVDEIRQLRENVRLASSGRFKVYIIDEVHMLTKEAFNALLKTLEEPPAHVKFFFATTEPEKVPETIMSRCQRFNLHRLSTSSIISKLNRIIEEEGIDISQETLFTIARYANGSIRDAESTLDKIVGFSGSKVRHKDVLQILGVVDTDVLVRVTEYIRDNKPSDLLRIIDRLFEEGKDIQQFVFELIGYFRNILIAKYGNETHSLIDLPKDAVDRIVDFSKDFTAVQLTEIMGILLRLQNELKWSSTKRITLEVAFVRLLQARNRITLDKLIEEVKAFEKKLGKPSISDKVSDKVQTQTPGQQSIPSLSKKKPVSAQIGGDQKGQEKVLLRYIEEKWNDILDSFGKKSPLMRSYLSEGHPVRFENNTLIIGFDKSCELHRDSLDRETNKKIVTMHFEEYLGRPVRLIFQILPDTELPKDGKKKRKKSVREIIDNPVVEKLRSSLGAKIIEVGN